MSAEVHPIQPWTQREAALALLNGDFGLSRKAGSFCGQVAVDDSPMSEKQAKWFAQLLEKADLPPLNT